MTTPLPPLVEIADVEVRLGETLADPELGQVHSLIAFASAKLRTNVPTIDTRTAVGTLSRDLVVGTVVSAVVRGLDTLRVGLRVRSEQYPEVQTTYMDATPDIVWFTPGELADLAPSAGMAGGPFTIRPGGGRW